MTGSFIRARIGSFTGQRRRLALIVMAGGLVFVSFLSLSSGAASIGLAKTAEILAEAVGVVVSDAAPHERAVILVVRSPRILLGFGVGGGLALAGALMQGLFRNPLADPTLVGISAGAMFGAASMMVLGGNLPFAVPPFISGLLIPLAAFAGAQMAGALLLRLSVRDGYTDVTTMLLAGIAINAMGFAGTSGLTYVATDEQLRSLAFWTMGSLGAATWSNVAVVGPLLAVFCLFAVRLARPLDAMLLGEAEAQHLGIAVERIKRRALLFTSMLVGLSVALCGMIGFVGLVVPHVLRLGFGPGHRFLLPTTLLVGPALILLADLLARTVVAPAELPIGVVTALVGGPFFLTLLRRGGAR